MGFFDGSSSDDSQWVALGINGFTCLLYGAIIRGEIKDKREKGQTIKKKNYLYMQVQ